MSETLDATLQEARDRDLARATRALLRHPLLRHGEDADALRLVRRHATELRAWFDQNTGWRLHVDAEVARLFKLGEPDAEASHPAREPRSHVPFGRRRYVLLCLALSVLERADAQITLGRLAEGIMVATADERLAAAGVTFELSGREERGDLVAVVRVLLELGALARVSGDEDAFVREAGDVLYDVERRVLAVLISAPRGPSTIAAHDFDARLRELTAEAEPVSDDLRTRAIRHRLTRRLLDDPVVYYDELTGPELAYLTSQRASLCKRISERAGLVAEIRAEGIAMVDPRDELTDVRMPEIGTDGHVALLITEYLAGRVDADGAGCPMSELHALVRQLAREHQAFWRRSTRDAGAEIGLVEHALERLVALRLVHRSGEAVHPLPALARFGLAAPTFPPETEAPS
ncbi:MAG: TIGR02678 family protein [Actinomycetota bacterium]|nr:TIGR02678 family protein [Actinomycetota bacterium]